MKNNLYEEIDHGTRIICAQLYKGGLSDAGYILNKLQKSPFKGRSPEMGMDVELISMHAEKAYNYHLTHAMIIGVGAVLGLILYYFNIYISAIIIAVTLAMMLWKYTYMDRSIAINNFSKKLYNPNYGLENDSRARKNDDAEIQNVIIFGEYFPFVGAGKRVKNWNFVIDTSKQSKSSDVESIGDVSIDEGYKAVNDEVLSKGIPNLTHEFFLFADGRELKSTFLEPYSPEVEPIYHLDQKVAFDEGHRNLFNEHRTYYCIKYFDKSRSTLLHASSVKTTIPP